MWSLNIYSKEDTDAINLLVVVFDEKQHYSFIGSFSRLLSDLKNHKAVAYNLLSISVLIFKRILIEDTAVNMQRKL